MKKFLLIIAFFVTFFCIIAVAQAAPTAQNFQNIQPFIDQTYNNGASNLFWLNTYTKNLYLATTSSGCASIGANGSVYSIGSPCGSSSGNTFAWPFDAHTGYVSTSTVLGLNGFFSTASSTISAPLHLSSLSDGCLNVSGGLVGSQSCTSSGSGVGTVSTSTVPTIGTLAYWTSNGYPSLLGGVATSTLTASSPLTGSFTQIGSGGSLGCQTASGSQAGCLSSTDWITFNNKQPAGSYLTSYDAWTHPFTLSSATTSLLYLNGFDSTASSTIGSSFHLPILSNGELAVFGGLVSSGATTTAGTGLTYTGNQFNVNTTQNITVLSNLIAAGTVNTTSGGMLYSTATSTPTVTSPITYSGTLGSFIGGSSGTFACATCNTSNASVSSVGLSDSNSTLTIGSTPVTTAGTITATFNLAHSNTWSVLQNFAFASTTGSGTFTGELTIPQSANPTLAGVGDIGFDTTSNNLVIATSSTGASVIAASATTTLYAFTATTSPIVSGTAMNLPADFRAQVVTGIICKVSTATSLVINLSNAAGSADTNAVTCTTTENQYQITTNDSYAAYGGIRLEYGTKTGDPGDISVRIIGYRTSN